MIIRVKLFSKVNQLELNEQKNWAHTKMKSQYNTIQYNLNLKKMKAESKKREKHYLKDIVIH